MISKDYIAWKNWTVERFGTWTRKEAAYFEAEIFSRVSPGPILEIGFGNGAFLGFARSKGVAVVGVELNELLVERAIQSGISAYACLDCVRGPFSAVVAIDVFEHIAAQDLPAYLVRLSDLLIPNGIIISMFPNGNSPFGLADQNGDFTHKTAFGRNLVKSLALLSGLELIYLGNPALPLRGVGFSLACYRGARKALAFLIERLIAFVYFFGEVLPLDPNCVAVFRKSSE